MEKFGQDLARVLSWSGDAAKQDNNTSKENTRAYGREVTQKRVPPQTPAESGEAASACDIDGSRVSVIGDNKTPEEQLSACLKTLKEKYNVDFPKLGEILGRTVFYQSVGIPDPFEMILDPLRTSQNIFDKKLYDLYDFLKHDIDAYRPELASLLIVILFVSNENKEKATAQTVINDAKASINKAHEKCFKTAPEFCWPKVTKDSEMELSGLKLENIPGATISTEYANRLTEYENRYLNKFKFKELVDCLPDTYPHDTYQHSPIIDILEELKSTCGTNNIIKQEIEVFKNEFVDNNHELKSWLKGSKKSFRDQNASFVLFFMDIMERKQCIGQFENSGDTVKAKSAKNIALKEFQALLKKKFNPLLLMRISSIKTGDQPIFSEFFPK